MGDAEVERRAQHVALHAQDGRVAEVVPKPK
jgi:hypothetical protein